MRFPSALLWSHLFITVSAHDSHWGDHPYAGQKPRPGECYTIRTCHCGKDGICTIPPTTSRPAITTSCGERPAIVTDYPDGTHKYGCGDWEPCRGGHCGGGDGDLQPPRKDGDDGRRPVDTPCRGGQCGGDDETTTNGCGQCDHGGSEGGCENQDDDKSPNNDNNPSPRPPPGGQKPLGPGDSTKTPPNSNCNKFSKDFDPRACPSDCRYDPACDKTIPKAYNTSRCCTTNPHCKHYDPRCDYTREGYFHKQCPHNDGYDSKCDYTKGDHKPGNCPRDPVEGPYPDPANPNYVYSCMCPPGERPVKQKLKSGHCHSDNEAKPVHRPAPKPTKEQSRHEAETLSKPKPSTKPAQNGLDPATAECYAATFSTMCVSECPESSFSIDGIEYIKACQTRTQNTKQIMKRYSGPMECLEAECNSRADCIGVGWATRGRVCHVHLDGGAKAQFSGHRNEHLIYKRSMGGF